MEIFIYLIMALIIYGLIGLIIYYLISKLENTLNRYTPPISAEIKKPIKNELNKNENNEKNYNIYYKPKRYIITLTELKFYNILLQIAKELDLILLAQVSLYNIVEPKETKYKNTAFNKIRSKSIDFVLVDKENCRIKLCIELDDYTHNRPNRIERDKFINELFKSLNINLIRFKASNYYDKEALKQRIKENIKNNYYIN